mgnify:CR=1 FL=1
MSHIHMYMIPVKIQGKSIEFISIWLNENIFGYLKM